MYAPINQVAIYWRFSLRQTMIEHSQTHSGHNKRPVHSIEEVLGKKRRA